MQVVEIKNEGLLREYTITLLASEIEEKVDYRLEDLRKTANIPGFRPGKVPTALLKKRFGKNVMGEVLEQAVSESSRQAIEDNTLRPAMQPNIEITKFEEGEDLEYKMAVEIMPDIEPMDFSKIEVERLVAKADEKEVSETIDRLASSTVTPNLSNGPARHERTMLSSSISKVRLMVRRLMVAAPKATIWNLGRTSLSLVLKTNLSVRKQVKASRFR